MPQQNAAAAQLITAIMEGNAVLLGGMRNIRGSIGEHIGNIGVNTVVINEIWSDQCLTYSAE